MIQAAKRAVERRLQLESKDPVLLANRANIEPDPWQADLLRSEAEQILLMCSRQAGKSTVTSLLALHQSLYVPSSLVLLLSPSLRQSQELFKKVKDSHADLQDNMLPTAQETSSLKMEFANDSRIIALPGNEATIRGFSGVALLIMDEASRIPDALYQAVRPMLAVSGGRIVLLSTPFGKRGFFHQEWTEGGEAWKRVKITAYDCPRISNDWLEAERKLIGDWWFSQEYLCEFVETNDQIFSYEDIQAALDPEIKPLFSGNN